MAYHIPYHRNTIRPVNDVVPGNASADNPVEFDIVPAWGADLARIKSIIFASIGLVHDGNWSPELQAATIAAFEHGGSVFINTVAAIRGLTVPAAMALRAGVIDELKPGWNLDSPVAIASGFHFSRICGAVPVMALHVASEIAKLSQDAQVDPRFFAQPSGSGGRATKRRTPSTAKSARSTSRRPATAASPAQTASPPAGTSDGRP